MDIVSEFYSTHIDPFHTTHSFLEKLFNGSNGSSSNIIINPCASTSLGKRSHLQTNILRPQITSLLNRVAILIFTSKSTGNTKAVYLTHTQIFASIHGKSSAIPLPPNSALLNWIALNHVASLVKIHLYTIYAGLHQVHKTAARILKDPLTFLYLASTHHVSRTFAPNFFLRMLRDALDSALPIDLQGIHLSNLLYIASRGEANNVDTCAQVTDHLLRLSGTERNIITPGFNITEIYAGAIFNTQSPDINIIAGRDTASLGLYAPGIEMRISPVVNTSREISERDQSIIEKGSLEIRGPIVFERYFNNNEATRQAFAKDGWFKTGDLIIIDSMGHLKFVGKLKDFININSIKYLPHEFKIAIDEEYILSISPSFVVCFTGRPFNIDMEGIYIIY